MAVVAIIVGASAVFVTRASAAPLVVNVTSTADAHTPGTLRDAFDQANAGVFDDVTINLPAGTYDLTLCGPDDDGNLTGDLDSTQDPALTINGIGGTATIVQTCPNDRLIDRIGGQLFSLSNVALSGGSPVASGGAIRSQASVVVTDATFSNNDALGPNGADQVCGVSPATDGATGVGGAIYSANDVTSVSSTFTSNTATGGAGGGRFTSACPPAGDPHGGFASGGAIHAGGTISVTGGQFRSNQARGGPGGTFIDGSGPQGQGGDAEGGALFGQLGVSLTDTQVIENQGIGGPAGGSVRGGAVQSGGGTTILRTAMTGNSAIADDGDADPCVALGGGAATGGAVLSSGPIQITGSDLSTNEARGAAGGSVSWSTCTGQPSGAPGGPAYGGAALAGGDITVIDSTSIGYTL